MSNSKAAVPISGDGLKTKGKLTVSPGRPEAAPAMSVSAVNEVTNVPR